MTVPSFLALSTPDDSTAEQIGRLLRRLQLVSRANAEAESFYDGTHVARQFGISIPPVMRDLQTVAGWGGTVVDVLEERLDWLGWSETTGEDFGLSAVYADNALDAESGMAQLDSLIFGVTFLSVGTGYDGEPHPLVVAHDPNSMTVEWDRRTRRASAAVSVDEADPDDPSRMSVTLYGPTSTDRFELRSGRWTRVDRDEHNLGRVPVVPLANRTRGTRDFGRSEITKAVRYYTEAAERTLLGLEVNREFYNAPARIGLNMDPEDFQDQSGNPVNQWSAIQGRMWMAPPNEAGDPEPKVVQFDPASPAPYIDQVRGYATLLAAEAGIPPSYLGYPGDQAASADAIRALESRLVKRAERRQVVFGRAWMEVGRLALLVRDGVVPENFDRDVSTKWRDAATPTRAAAADEAAKLIGAQVLPADSTVTYDRVGLSPAEQRQLQADKRRTSGGAALLSAVDRAASDAPSAAAQDMESAKAISAKAEALGQLIRSGVVPESAADVLGLAGLRFTGATPVTLRLPESQAQRLEDK